LCSLALGSVFQKKKGEKKMSQDKASLIDASATAAVIDRSKTAIENMINLDPMTAETLLENIRIRYTGNLIYT
jgi:hypothetical protein